MGLPCIPQPVIVGWEVSAPLAFLHLGGISCAVTPWFIHLSVQSPFGRALKAIRKNEVFAKAAGKNFSAYKAPSAPVWPRWPVCCTPTTSDS